MRNEAVSVRSKDDLECEGSPPLYIVLDLSDGNPAQQRYPFNPAGIKYPWRFKIISFARFSSTKNLPDKTRLDVAEPLVFGVLHNSIAMPRRF